MIPFMDLTEKRNWIKQIRQTADMMNNLYNYIDLFTQEAG
jgi:hypothetical protein